MLSDTDRETLDTIEVRLLQLNEDSLLEDITETDFAFGVHDALTTTCQGRADLGLAGLEGGALHAPGHSGAYIWQGWGLYLVQSF